MQQHHQRQQQQLYKIAVFSCSQSLKLGRETTRCSLEFNWWRTFLYKVYLYACEPQPQSNLQQDAISIFLLLSRRLSYLFTTRGRGDGICPFSIMDHLIHCLGEYFLDTLARFRADFHVFDTRDLFPHFFSLNEAIQTGKQIKPINRKTANDLLQCHTYHL